MGIIGINSINVFFIFSCFIKYCIMTCVVFFYYTPNILLYEHFNVDMKDK